MRVLMLGKQSSWMGLHLSHIEAAFRRRGHEIIVGDYHRMALFCGISLPGIWPMSVASVRWNGW